MNTTTEADIAGIQSTINGWIIEIQTINAKIEEAQKRIDEIIINVNK